MADPLVGAGVDIDQGLSLLGAPATQALLSSVSVVMNKG